MRFAFIEGQRQEAQPRLSGECPMCGTATIAKCGEKNIWHWAHEGKRNCDHWWENETEWHRNWKDHFPVEWQEVVQIADDGEKHIADVKTDQEWVIEFQHSYIKPEERQSREAFYGNMVWIVNGLRRKNDHKQFAEAVNDGHQISQDPVVNLVYRRFCRLMEEWSTSLVPVFFDFGEEIKPHGLWLLIPMDLDISAYLAPVGKEDFIGWHSKGGIDLQPFIDQIKTYELKNRRESAEYFQDLDLLILNNNGLLVFCKGCGRSSELDVKALVEAYGPQLAISEIGRRARCVECGRKGGVVEVVR